ncbi:VOC family protein [Mumia sp. DW29H23]|uniref:VOC family protein n=1 Tax=Mumia sp. DW29H23 TaxID=3421241 RepID=UPI003D691238
MATTWGLTIDCESPARVAAFWSLALGYVEPEPPAGHESWQAWLSAQGVPEAEWDDGAYLASPDGNGPTLSFLKVPERKQVKNRLHLDLKVSGGREVAQDQREAAIRATVSRLCDVGASVVTEHAEAGSLDHIVMADPEGNEFCVV